jgi:AP-2 complex subunit mu-1
MDNGYPQLTAINVLPQLIQVAKPKVDIKIADAPPDQIGNAVTGAVDWRQPNQYKYRKNEVYIDVLESVNLLMSTQGQVLRSDVSGKVIMKAYLTGMPECTFGMNDKLLFEQEAKHTGHIAKRHRSGIAIDDVSFHRCVRLGKWDEKRVISFVPPDGQFELMKYRVTNGINLPFRVIPVVVEHGRTRVEYEVKIKGNFGSSMAATNVIAKIPCPPNAAKAKISVSMGKAKFVAEQKCIVWKFKQFPGSASGVLKGEVSVLASAVDKKAWSRPPITMSFQVPMFSSSGLHVRFLKVFERQNYHTTKWVRYISRNGNYQIRF